MGFGLKAAPLQAPVFGPQQVYPATRTPRAGGRWRKDYSTKSARAADNIWLGIAALDAIAPEPALSAERIGARPPLKSLAHSSSVISTDRRFARPSPGEVSPALSATGRQPQQQRPHRVVAPPPAQSATVTSTTMTTTTTRSSVTTHTSVTDPATGEVSRVAHAVWTGGRERESAVPEADLGTWGEEGWSSPSHLRILQNRVAGRDVACPIPFGLEPTSISPPPTNVSTTAHKLAFSTAFSTALRAHSKSPKYHIPQTSRESIFTVELNKHPASGCRFRDLRHSLVTPRFPDIGAFGTRMAFYEYVVANNRITLRAIIMPDPDTLNDTAPIERWNYDLLEDDGINRIRQVVQDVKAMCRALGQRRETKQAVQHQASFLVAKRRPQLDQLRAIVGGRCKPWSPATTRWHGLA
ncbi:hypothetical protein EDB89DRAFT_2231711 [Lactarius sanguifluus]|nr:hypothetical protein EDB89DRAFT_2231711 [Lactarius sanguifluus]